MSPTVAAHRFAWLSEHPEWVAELAALHHAQWRTLLPHWSLPDAVDELATHTGREAIPTTRLALVDGKLAGSVSLLGNDDERLREHAPWLASLLVLPPFRRRGLGAALVAEAVRIAARLGVPRLYLYTDDAAGWYERLGWRRVGQAALDATTVDVLGIDTGRAA